MLMLCGSPHADGNSKFLLDRINDCLAVKADIFNAIISPDISRGALIEAVKHDEVIVFSFPLYADSLPAYLLKFLTEVEKEIAEINSESVVYACLNNGFYDAKQNAIAIRVVKSWCEKCSIAFGGAIAIGGGGMFQAAPFGKGPMAKAAAELTRFAKAAEDKREIGIIYTEPSLPRFMYCVAGNMGMKSEAKKNGLTAREIEGAAMPNPQC